MSQKKDERVNVWSYIKSGCEDSRDMRKLLKRHKDVWPLWKGPQGETIAHVVARYKPSLLEEISKRDECPENFLLEKDQSGADATVWYVQSDYFSGRWAMSPVKPPTGIRMILTNEDAVRLAIDSFKMTSELDKTHKINRNKTDCSQIERNCRWFLGMCQDYIAKKDDKKSDREGDRLSTLSINKIKSEMSVEELECFNVAVLSRALLDVSERDYALKSSAMYCSIDMKSCKERHSQVLFQTIRALIYDAPTPDLVRGMIEVGLNPVNIKTPQAWKYREGMSDKWRDVIIEPWHAWNDRRRLLEGVDGKMETKRFAIAL